MNEPRERDELSLKSRLPARISVDHPLPPSPPRLPFKHTVYLTSRPQTAVLHLYVWN